MLSECVLYNKIAGKYDIMSIIGCNSIFITLFTVFLLSLWWCNYTLSKCVLYNIIVGKYDIM